VDEYAAKEGPIALKGLFANIGTKGSKSSGAHQGVVIASPSTGTFGYFASSPFTDARGIVDPNYLYTWIRQVAISGVGSGSSD
jgi:hypothetical protein